jgi:hypothetical protein
MPCGDAGSAGGVAGQDDAECALSAMPYRDGFAAEDGGTGGGCGDGTGCCAGGWAGDANRCCDKTGCANGERGQCSAKTSWGAGDGEQCSDKDSRSFGDRKWCSEKVSNAAGTCGREEVIGKLGLTQFFGKPFLEGLRPYSFASNCNSFKLKRSRESRKERVHYAGRYQ